MGVKVLVVVDMQNDFIDGALGTEEAPMIIDNVVEKIEKYINDPDGIIMLTRDEHFEDTYMDSEEGKNLPVKHCIFRTTGNRIHERIDELIDANFRKKQHLIFPYDQHDEEFELKISAFYKNTFGSLHLGEELNRINHKLQDYNKSIESIELVGLCTDICVISNAVIAKAACPNAHIIVDARCCAGVTDESHDRALECMKTLHVQVVGQGEEPWRNKNA